MIILASASPRRQELLRQIGCVFQTVASCAVEDHRPDIPPERLAADNALAKAAAVAGQYPADAVLGADTVVALAGRVFGKPASRREAVAMLSALSGRSHEVYTGIALCKGGASWIDVARTRVYFAPLAQAQIERYVSSGEPMDKAGAYAIQGRAAVFIERIEGCYSNVVGLPLHALARLAEKAGIDLQ